jgi:hypothetical protein
MNCLIMSNLFSEYLPVFLKPFCPLDSIIHSVVPMSFGGSKTVRKWKLFARKFWRFEGRFGLVTSGIPLIGMCYFMMYVGVVVMDKQAEHRYMRVQSLTNRELSLKEEHEAMREMLLKADKLDDGSLKPLPVSGS